MVPVQFSRKNSSTPHELRSHLQTKSLEQEREVSPLLPRVVSLLTSSKISYICLLLHDEKLVCPAKKMMVACQRRWCFHLRQAILSQVMGWDQEVQLGRSQSPCIPLHTREYQGSPQAVERMDLKWQVLHFCFFGWSYVANASLINKATSCFPLLTTMLHSTITTVIYEVGP